MFGNLAERLTAAEGRLEGGALWMLAGGTGTNRDNGPRDPLTVVRARRTRAVGNWESPAPLPAVQVVAADGDLRADLEGRA